LSRLLKGLPISTFPGTSLWVLPTTLGRTAVDMQMVKQLNYELFAKSTEIWADLLCLRSAGLACMQDWTGRMLSGAGNPLAGVRD